LTALAAIRRRPVLGARKRGSSRCSDGGASTTVVAEQGDAEGLSLMFQLALRTAMRMREIYTLTQDQVSIARKTIFLQKTKNGDRREVSLGANAPALVSW